MIITVTLLLLRPAAQGAISPSLVAVFLMLLVAFRAMGRGMGKGISRAVRLAFTVGLPFASLLMFALSVSQGNLKNTATILGALGALILSLMGIYIMFRGFSR